MTYVTGVILLLEALMEEVNGNREVQELSLESWEEEEEPAEEPERVRTRWGEGGESCGFCSSELH